MSDHPVQISILTPEDSTYANPVLTPRSTPPRTILQDMILEFVGSTIFIYISLAGVHQAVVAGSVDQIHIALSFLIGLTAGVSVALQSGAHLNPGISFTMWIMGEISFGRFIGYVASQLAGGLIASLLVMMLYYRSFDQDSQSYYMLGSLGTIKNSNVSLFSSIIDQIMGSAMLMAGVLTVPESKYKPLMIGAVLGSLGLFQGMNGFAFNPARDLGPRIISTIAYGSNPFTAADYWFWIPLTMPFVGMPIAYVLVMLWRRDWTI